MKKLLLFTIISLCFSVQSSKALKVQANFSYCSFYTPEQGPYLETYLSVVGNSLTYLENDNGKLQAGLEITLIFKQAEKIIDFKKYTLMSTELADSNALVNNLIDQQRFSLPNGEYDFEIILRDINSTDAPFTNVQKLIIDFNESAMDISDIELIQSFQKTKTKNILSKNGYDLLPYTSDFYGEDFEKIAFYAEIYNADKTIGVDEDYLINYYIESYETGKIVSNYRSFKREKSKAVNIVFSSFDIKNLPSGNYKLVIEGRSKANSMLVSKKVFFQRSNPNANPLLISDDYVNSFVADMSIDQLNDNIKCLTPIATPTEISFAKNQLGAKDTELMRQYFYNFWLTRNPTEPEKDWKEYKELVDITQQEYATSIKRGYETDRGRIFLKYGKPNTISELKNEPSSYPYEIWHYYSTEVRSNVKFIFYNTDVASNDYPLLHSTMPGEIFNSQWRVDLHKRTNATRGIDQEAPREYMLDRTEEFYTLPK